MLGSLAKTEEMLADGMTFPAESSTARMVLNFVRTIFSGEKRRSDSRARHGAHHVEQRQVPLHMRGVAASDAQPGHHSWQQQPGH